MEIKIKLKSRIQFFKKPIRFYSGIKVLFNNRVYTVLAREREKVNKNKPLYYLFDIQNKKYLSSLYPTEKENVFIFDEKETGKQYQISFHKENKEKPYEIVFLGYKDKKKRVKKS